MSEVINIKIKQFEPDKMIPDKNCLIVGPQYSGKTHLLKNLLYYINAPFGVLVHPNEFATETYGNMLPKQCKLDDINKEMLHKFCNRSRTLIEFNKRYDRKLDGQACLILDNCVPDLLDMKWDKNQDFKFLFRAGKDANISTIITAPYPLKMPQHYLSAIDYVFILRDTNKKYKKMLFDMFGGMFDTFEQFNSVMTQCTADYGCMVIDCTKLSGNLSDSVYWYKAPRENRKFYMGSPKLWEMCINSSITLDELLMEPLRLFSKNGSSHTSSSSSSRR